MNKRSSSVEFFNTPFKNIVCGITLRQSGDYKKDSEAWRFLSNENKFSEKILILNQVHSAKIKHIISEKDFPPYDKSLFAVDGALVENINKFAIGIRVADCMPVFIFVKGKLCGALHAGWRGVAEGIGKKMGLLLLKKGTNAENIEVFVGPHISGKYLELAPYILKKFPADCVINNRVNLFRALKLDMCQAGLKYSNINLFKKKNYCTYENKKYFSHRRGNPQRMLAFAIQQ